MNDNSPHMDIDFDPAARARGYKALLRVRAPLNLPLDHRVLISEEFPAE
jgi:hypothetical protein